MHATTYRFSHTTLRLALCVAYCVSAYLHAASTEESNVVNVEEAPVSSPTHDTPEVQTTPPPRIEPEPQQETIAPPALDTPDDSSERVGFGSSTSPLDAEPSAKVEAPATPEEPAQAAPDEQSASPHTEPPVTSKPEKAPQKKVPTHTTPSQSDPPVAAIDEVDDSSERVGFDQDTSPLAKDAPRRTDVLHQTGIPFVDDTVYFIAPRAYYRYFDSGNGDTSEAFAMGGSAGLKSGMFKDFASIRLTTHTSQKVMSTSDDQDDDNSAGLLQGNDSYSVITEANLNLKIQKANIRLGIQRIDLPYINSNDARMVPNTFKAYTVQSKPTENIGFELGYVDGMRERTGSDYESLSEQAGADDSDEGVYMLGARYTFNDSANIGFVEINNPDVLNVFYIEANTLLPWFDLIQFDAGFQFTDQRSIGNELLGDVTIQQYGFKLRARYEKLVSTLVFTHTGSNSEILKPWGGSPSYNSMMISDFDRAGEKAVGGSLSYRFSGKANEGFVSSVRWTYGNTPDSGKNASSDQYEINWNFDYYPKTIPNLWFRLRTARNYQDDSDSDDAKDVRLIVNYVKTF